MNEHEKLNEILVKIGLHPNYIITGTSFDSNSKYMYQYLGNNITYKKYSASSQGWRVIGRTMYRYINPREIIFTPKFSDCLKKYDNIKYQVYKDQILDNLDNPTDYIFNLLELGTKNT